MNPGIRSLIRISAALALAVFTVGVAQAQHPGISVEGNFFYNNGSGVTDLTCGVACNLPAWCDPDLAPYNFSTDPGLNPNHLDEANLEFDLLPGAAATLLGGASLADVPSCDGSDFFVKTSYAGAVPPRGSQPGDEYDEDWYSGWTYFDIDGGLSRTDIDTGLPVVNVVSDIVGNQTWVPANNYVISGRIGVQPGVTLTIEAGTVILGQGVGSYLVVERDGDLVINGTAEAPVIFTSGQPLGSQFPGDWGGVVIHGKAVSNCATGGTTEGCNLTTTGNDCESEGGAGFFGGSDDTDNSGTIRYARVEYAGQEISANNELNAWTFNGIGSGTTIDHLQAHLGTDDCFEWFGGTCQARYLIGTFGADDGLDWQMGFRGKVQFAIIKTSSLIQADKGIEADNNEFDYNCPGRSNPTFANLTLVGGDLCSDGINLRRGTAGKVFNSIVTNWVAYGLDFDNNADTLPTGCLDLCSDLTVTGVPVSSAAFAVAVSPNPVRASSTFRFALRQESPVQIRIFDTAGRVVDEVYNGTLGAGDQIIGWSPRKAANGVYYYQVVAGSNSAQGKVLVLN